MWTACREHHTIFCMSERSERISKKSIKIFSWSKCHQEVLKVLVLNVRFTHVPHSFAALTHSVSVLFRFSKSDCSSGFSRVFMTSGFSRSSGFYMKKNLYERIRVQSRASSSIERAQRASSPVSYPLRIFWFNLFHDFKSLKGLQESSWLQGS